MWISDFVYRPLIFLNFFYFTFFTPQCGWTCWTTKFLRFDIWTQLKQIQLAGGSSFKSGLPVSGDSTGSLIVLTCTGTLLLLTVKSVTSWVTAVMKRAEIKVWQPAAALTAFVFSLHWNAGMSEHHGGTYLEWAAHSCAMLQTDNSLSPNLDRAFITLNLLRIVD